ncbi:hypothetical protein PCANC_26863 [Puccinia coronata f. sp. avenae]|uniref:Telomere length regulation protein conserved domain-containing protein n=1 Tax=Puccinia coronata f. sp. avenae TaxID=200324 RepID=A0A2N5S2N0_9BASI|nr:hypothetical protein PCANC_26863 [Puccinia coronata f. sp. avenae]
MLHSIQISCKSGNPPNLLVLLLLTAHPVNGQQQKQSSTRSTSVHPRNVALDPVFVDAIQRSLSSLHPQFRLLGMLMAELITHFHRLPESTKLDFGHNFAAAENQENRLCVAICQLSNHWSPAKQCPNHLWHDLLSSLASNHQTKLLPASDHNQPPAPQDTAVETSTLPSPKLLSDPNKLTLTELRLTRNKNLRQKPVMEVLESTPADALLEPYKIAEEDLESLYPPSGGQKGPPAASVLEPEFDYAQIKDQAPKPVYLFQLSQYLKDLDNFERIHIALIKAETLIRRKWDWGTKLGFKKINAPPIHQLLLHYQGSQLDLPHSPSIPTALSSSVLLDQQPSSLEYVQQQPKPKWISHQLVAQRKGYGEQDDPCEDWFEGCQVVRPGPMILQDVDKRFLRIIVNRMGWYLDEFSRMGGRMDGAVGAAAGAEDGGHNAAQRGNYRQEMIHVKFDFTQRNA